MKTTHALLLTLAISTTAAHAATTMTFDASGSRIIGHNQVFGITSSQPEQIWNQGGSQITHPFHTAFEGFYNRLVTEDAFDNSLGSNTGNELAQGTHAGYFGSTILGGHQFQSLGVTATNSNAVHLSMSGFVMKTGSHDDFYFHTGSGLEYRIYRGGDLGFFEELNPTTFNKVLAYQDVDLQFVIDYANNTIAVDLLSATPDTGGGLPSVALTNLSSSSLHPVLVSDTTANGPFGRYSTNDLSFTFEAVPEPSRALFVMVGLTAIIARRKRDQAKS